MTSNHSTISYTGFGRSRHPAGTGEHVRQMCGYAPRGWVFCDGHLASNPLTCSGVEPLRPGEKEVLKGIENASQVGIVRLA